jgi:hypothetical protein
MEVQRFADGHYTNPLLKPQAADVVKKRAEFELNGMAVFANPLAENGDSRPEQDAATNSL